jgi:hypothetical protein
MKPLRLLSSALPALAALGFGVTACNSGTAANVSSGSGNGSGESASGSGANSGQSESGAASGTPSSGGSGSSVGSGSESGNQGGQTSGTSTTMADAQGESVDAPSEDALPEGSTPCVTMGTELCDGFESNAIDPSKWKMSTTNGTSITVDSMQVHSGQYALHIKLPMQQSTAQIQDTVTFPAMDNQFYTRAFFYFSPDLPMDNAGGYHEAYLLATGNNVASANAMGGFVQAGLGSAGAKQYVGFSEYYEDGPNVAQHGSAFYEFGPDSPANEPDGVVVPKTWICMELWQDGDMTKGVTNRRVWINDKELTEQNMGFSMLPPPTFSMMSIGVLQYHTTPILTDVWVDDVRVSSQKIGCENLSQ